MWLWRDWGPWIKSATLTERGPILSDPCVDAQNKLHLLVEPHEPGGPKRCLHVIRDLSTGRTLSSEPALSERDLTAVAKKDGAEIITTSFTDVDEDFLRETFVQLGCTFQHADCLPMQAFQHTSGQYILVGTRTLIRFENDYATSETDDPRKSAGGKDLLKPTYQLWRQTRPAKWHGIFRLPQTWLVAALAAVFLWSLYRDTRRA